MTNKEEALKAFEKLISYGTKERDLVLKNNGRLFRNGKEYVFIPNKHIETIRTQLAALREDYVMVPRDSDLWMQLETLVLHRDKIPEINFTIKEYEQWERECNILNCTLWRIVTNKKSLVRAMIPAQTTEKPNE
jgi:hypothetical protein